MTHDRPQKTQVLLPRVPSAHRLMSRAPAPAGRVSPVVRGVALLALLLALMVVLPALGRAAAYTVASTPHAGSGESVRHATVAAGDDLARTSAPVAAPESVGREIVLIDSRVPDAMELTDGLRRQRADGRDIHAVRLNADKDSVAQINRILAGEQNLAAIHVISHGSAGAITMGSTRLDAARLAVDAGSVARWGRSLADGGDLLLYGCDVAQGAAGRAFVSDLARLTGADVAASDDLTGQPGLGRDWTLEHRVGTVETPTAIGEAAQRDWAHSLAIAIDATFTGTSTGGSLSVSHTTAGRNRLMLVGVSINLAGANSVSAMTYNGASLSLVGTRTSGDARTEIWSLVAPAVGTSNVSITVSGTSDGVTAGVMTFTGVDQTTPLGAFASNAGGGGSGTVTVASAVEELVFGTISVDDAANYDLVPGQPGQAEHWDLIGGPNINGGGSTRAGAASVALSWSWPGSDVWTAGGVSVKPSAAGPSVTTSFRNGNANGYSSNADTFVSAATPTTNHATSSSLETDFAGGPSEQALIRFDGIFGTGAGQIPLGSYITSASLTVNVNNPSSSGATIGLHAMISSWADTPPGTRCRAGSRPTTSKRPLPRIRSWPIRRPRAVSRSPALPAVCSPGTAEDRPIRAGPW